MWCVKLSISLSRSSARSAPITKLFRLFPHDQNMSDKRDNVANQLKSHGCTRHMDAKTVTTSNGAPVDTITASLTAGPQGVIALKDFTLIDHLAAFDRERIPERVVHAKGAGAFGYFETTSPAIKKYCKAKLFSEVGKKTPLAVRFSTVGGESGSADTARDPRGFAVKFYTEEGNWDLVGNNTPIFFIRDPILFPSFIHTQKRNPATHCKDPDAMWDFISLRPETTHQVSFLFSDRGTPDGYRFMNGYGSHTFKAVNESGVASYVKWHFKTDQGIRNLSAAEADRLASADPDYAIRDLYNAIDSADLPSWTLYFQVMSEEQASKCPFNPFDLTKIWPHSLCPLQEVGRMVLDRNPSNYFAEVEQLAFAPSHMVPGIEPSPDKMLQARLFSYADTHRHRLGVNYQSIPVNCPYASRYGVNNFQRDGGMRVDGNQGGAPNYFPNSFGGAAPAPAAASAWHKEAACPHASALVARYETGDEDNFTQCGQFFRKVLSAEERERLTDNIAGNLAQAQDFIQARAIANFAAADANYGRMIKQKVDRIKKSAASKSTGGKVDIVMKNYGKINSLAQIEETDAPQLITGRILPVSNFLTAPISGKPCVYYEARCEQLVERTDENGLAGEIEDGKVWEFRCGDTVAADFTLFDPAFPSVELYVPGTQVPIKVHATEEIRAGRSKVFKQSKVPDHTKDFLKKHKCHVIDNSGKIEKNVRFREANFEFGEQIAVLGIVRQITDEHGDSRKVLFPVNYEVFTEEFCQSKGWSDWDRRSWRDLTKKPSIVLTDMPDYFQNVKIDVLPSKLSRKLSAPIDLSLFKNPAAPASVHSATSAADGAQAEGKDQPAAGATGAQPMER